MTHAIELYLVRHGIAEAHGDAWPDDTKRPLSATGISRFRKIARALAALDVTFDAILTSPLVRTRQTAEILADAFETKPPVVPVDALAPGSPQAALIAELGKQTRKVRRLALVGHEPGIGELTARLIGARHAISFKKGGVCRIDVEALPPTGPGELRWFLPPKVLRAVRK